MYRRVHACKADHDWVLLRDLSKDDVPIGSRVFADAITATSFLVDG
jgi:hypothetical protein